MEIRQSTFDPAYWEVLLDGVVIQEMKISFPLRGVPRDFVSLDAITTWLEETEYKLVKAAAYRLLARRSYSKAMLFRKLKEKKFSEKTYQKVIEEIEKLGYLSDSDFGYALVEQKIRQGYGPYYIERFLQEKGLDSSIVRQKMDAKTQKESIKKWALKLRGKDPAKMTAFLMRRGFDLEMIRCI